MHQQPLAPNQGFTIIGHSTSPWDYVPDYVTGRRLLHPVALHDEERLFHTHIIGKTGAGKSQLLATLMRGDLERGHGFALLDPHGDLAERMLDLVPRSRLADVVYVNPADLEFPVPMNVLEAVDLRRHHLVAAGLVSIFKRFWADFWGPRTEYLIKNVVFALLETPGATLLDLNRLLVEEEFRADVVARLTNPAVAHFWAREYAAYSANFRQEVIAPIQNKAGEFTVSPLMRNIVGQRKNRFDLRALMDEGKLLIVNLSKGQLGEDVSALLGSMLLTRLLLAAYSRQDVPEASRRPFFVYVDELASFATQSTLSAFLAESRKFSVALIASGQFLAALSDDLRAALSNAGTLVSFQLGAEDAEYIAKEMPPLVPEQLMNLDRHHVYVKQTAGPSVRAPFSAVTLPPVPVGESYRAQIIRRSRDLYARPRAVVERETSAPALPALTRPFPGRAPMAGAQGGVSRRRSDPFL